MNIRFSENKDRDEPRLEAKPLAYNNKRIIPQSNPCPPTTLCVALRAGLNVTLAEARTGRRLPSRVKRKIFTINSIE